MLGCDKADVGDDPVSPLPAPSRDCRIPLAGEVCRVEVGDLGAVDSAEATIDDVACHLPFELFVTPVFEVFEHEQTQDNFRGCAVPAASTALGKANPLRSDDVIDQRLIVEQFIHATEDRIHQLFGTGDHAEQHELRESHLPLTPTIHACM